MIRKHTWLIHLLGTITFLIVPILFAPHPPEARNILLEAPTIRDFLASCFMLLIFYLNYYLFIPRFYFKKKYLEYGFFILLGLIVIAYLPSVLTGHDLWGQHPHSEVNPPFHSEDGRGFPPRPDTFNPLQEIRHHIFLYVAVIMFSVLLRVRSRMFQAENDKLYAELANLKTQIHPHFLFNTLNSIYALAIRKDDKTPETIVKLSEFMRYLLKDSNQNVVALDKEITYIENYIDLQKSRLRNSVKVHYQTSGDFRGLTIAPLVLFTYIENAFKHGVNPDQDSEISIEISVLAGTLTLMVANKLVTMVNKDTSLHIGLQNTAERLEIMYPDKYRLVINDTDGVYLVTLEIELR